MDAQTEMTPRERIEKTCRDLGLTMTAEFVPFSQSRNAKPKEDGKVWRSLNWRVSIWRAIDRVGKIDKLLVATTDYSAGEAHCPAYKAKEHGRPGFMSIDRDKAIAYEVEHGRRWWTFAGPVKSTNGKDAKDIMPDMVDVVASLVMDASVIDCGTFEEWASEYGMDTDSRKAEATYRACLETALKLRNGIGEAGLQKLRDACQDY